MNGNGASKLQGIIAALIGAAVVMLGWSITADREVSRRLELLESRLVRVETTLELRGLNAPQMRGSSAAKQRAPPVLW